MLEVTAKRVTRPRAILAFTAVLAAVVASVTAAFALNAPFLHALPPVVMVSLALAILGPSLIFARRAGRRPPASGTLRVDEEALSWDGVPVFARGKLREAIAYTNGRKHGVRVRTRWRTAFFELPTREEADRVVAALGKDSSQAALSVANQGFAVASLWYSSMQIFSGHHGPWTIALLVFVIFVLPLLLSWLLGRRWVVGSDGLLLRRAVGKGRFIPYADVESIRVEKARLKVGLRDKSELKLLSKDDSRETSTPVVGARALASRIEQAKARAAARGEAGDVAGELVRGDRDVGAWMASLRGLLDRPAEYRVAAVPRERLWSALEDVTQPAEIRAAAAAALRPRLAEDEKPRLRVAAAACASPKLRVALEAAEASDDEKLEEALEAVAAKASRARG